MPPRCVSKSSEKVESSKDHTCQVTLVDTIAKSAKYASSSAQANELNRAVTYHLAKDAVQLSVNKPGFY